MKNLICLINSYLAFFIFHLFFLHFSMTTLLQLGVYLSPQFPSFILAKSSLPDLQITLRIMVYRRFAADNVSIFVQLDRVFVRVVGD